MRYTEGEKKIIRHCVVIMDYELCKETEFGKDSSLQQGFGKLN